MNTWKVILATLVIFGAGVITGGLLVGYSERAARLVPRKPAPAEPQPQRETGGGPNTGAARENRQPQPPNILLRKDLVDRLNRELKLNPEQRERIDKIVTEGQDRTRDLWRVEWNETRQRIRKELLPEQQTRFEELFKPRSRDQRRIPAAPDRLPTNSPPAAASTPPNP